ncbi:hypothetical protein Trydic_g9312 [Trypoxylus dichotomus]
MSDRRFALVERSTGGGVLSAFTEKLSVAAVNLSTLGALPSIVDVVAFGYLNPPKFNVPDLNDRKTTSILLPVETLNLRHLKNVTNLTGKLLDLVLTNLDVEFTVAHD